MYSAPLSELQFVLHALLGDGVLAELPELDDYSPDFADAVLQEAAVFAEEVLAPINQLADRTGAVWTAEGVTTPSVIREAYRRFVAAGWPSLRGPKAYGGQMAPLLLCTAVEELWASANLSFKLCHMLTRGAIEAIERCGSTAQQSLYLPKLISGEWTGTMNLTEPQAGSDLSLIRTRAELTSQGYRLYGQKIFISWGDHDLTDNTIHLVLARIDGAPAGTKGISLFIVPKVLVHPDGSLGARNDVRCLSIERKLGIHASPTCVMSYGEQGGALGFLVGEPNRGLEYMFIMMNAARLSVGLEGYALGERAYQQAAGWAATRRQGKGPASDAVGAPTDAITIDRHPDVRRMLLTMRASVEAARALALYAALQLDLGSHGTDASVRTAAQTRGDLLIPIVKGYATEMGVEVASLGIQVHGGMGYVEDTGAAQFLRDARIGPIYEGTTGIQALDLLNRKVGRDQGAALYRFVNEMRLELERIDAGDVGPRGIREASLSALLELEHATRLLLGHLAHDARHAQAVAVPFLKLCGLTMGGWLLAKADALAARGIGASPDFLAAKRTTAHFYATHLLPGVSALRQTIEHGAAF